MIRNLKAASLAAVLVCILSYVDRAQSENASDKVMKSLCAEVYGTYKQAKSAKNSNGIHMRRGLIFSVCENMPSVYIAATEDAPLGEYPERYTECRKLLTEHSSIPAMARYLGKHKPQTEGPQCENDLKRELAMLVINDPHGARQLTRGIKDDLFITKMQVSGRRDDKQADDIIQADSRIACELAVRMTGVDRRTIYDQGIYDNSTNTCHLYYERGELLAGSGMWSLTVSRGT